MTASRPDIFLSYSREDLAVARRFAQALQLEGYVVWWDQALVTGQSFEEVTEKALEEARAVVVLWSKHSVASRWVRAEATQADQAGKLMPVMIEGCKRPIKFELTQSAELSHWNGDASDPAWQAFLADLKRIALPGAISATAPPPAPHDRAESSRTGSRRTLLLATSLVVIALLAAAVWTWQRMEHVRKARAAVPEIAALVDKGDFPGAFARANEIRRYIPDDAMLKSLTPLFTAEIAIDTEPEGAEAYVRAYADEKAEWKHVGRTPIAHLELPREAQRWRFEKAGFATAERANSSMSYQNPVAGPLGRGAGKLVATLLPEKEQPAGMVYVPGTPASVKVSPSGLAVRFSQIPPQEIPAFFVDRLEVSNAQYKEFLDAGGYERRSMWEGLDLKKDGKPLAIEDALKLFIDSTGRPGPATWELGSYPEGKGDYPVSGVSWYEAAAYARFRGKSLPTVYHWARTAFLGDELASSFSASISPQSNFGTSGPAPAGRYAGLGPYGTYDLFGNVREWLQNLNPVGGGWVIGGSWEDPAYAYAITAPLSLLERSPRNGFRLVKQIGEPVNGIELAAALDLDSSLSRKRGSIHPVSDEVFATMKAQFEYTAGPLNPTPAVVMSANRDWTKQRVTIDAGYDGERMDLILFIPKRGKPPWQPVILISGSQIFAFAAKSESIEPGFAAMPLDYLVKSGRMLVQPIFQGSYERFKSPLVRADTARMTRSMIQWRSDLGRTIDYLATRTDVDAARIGYVGISFGGGTAVPLLAVEPRIRTAVLLSGGLDNLTAPFLDPANYAPRIRMPVLMVNGRYDEVFPVESGQAMLYELLGTPSADKRHVIFDSGHGSPPRGETLREVLAWYDKYLGPVNN